MNEIAWGELIFTFLTCYVCYKFGEHIALLKITKALIDNPKEVEKLVNLARKEKESNLEELDIPEPLKVERHGSQIYLYNEKTDEFLAQGSTLQEALDNTEKRYPNKQFKGYLSKDEADRLGVSVK